MFPVVSCTRDYVIRQGLGRGVKCAKLGRFGWGKLRWVDVTVLYKMRWLSYV